MTLLNNIGHLDELNGMKKLSALELEFMQYIWDFPDGVNTMDIYSHFDLARGTMTTIIYRIVNKGYLKKVKKDGLHYVYIYTVSRTYYEKAIMRQQLKEMQRDPSLFRAVAAFCGKENASVSPFLVAVSSVRNSLFKFIVFLPLRLFACT